MLQRAIADVLDIFSKARDDGDWAAATGAWNSIIKWVGASAPDRVEHTLSAEAYDAGLEELRAHAIETAEDGALIAELERRGIKVSRDV
jgi:hypothetical protein